ncbi:variable large family protein [Borrelia turicatae]|uniref:Variable large protein n=1 Tax=Borrelia turicatae (strain 91E135) TaxID=314724 RepID=A0ABF7R011_BORT9|nr:variable large family protein [Borrelia turicatae]ASJ27764.1 VlpB1 [Borrelia turicatae 91E135]UPA14341.1 variable large family protein [Borrelia turicatae 91E135]
MKRITLSALLMTLFLLLGCGSGQLQAEKLAAESKISFFDSLIKIGQGFQEIFGIFGNAIGDTFGLTAVKSDDKKSKVGEHFERIKKGLEDTNGKLKELSSEISEAKNANNSTIEAVKGAIKGANDVFEQLIASLTKLADVTKEDALLGGHNNNAAPGAADKDGVEAIIAGVKDIIDAAEKSDVKIEKGTEGGAITANASTDAPAVLGGNNAHAAAGAGSKLADEVTKADPWAMIDKIKNATATTPAKLNGADNEAGALAASNDKADAAAGAKSNADLVAAVALKAMTKNGKFSAVDADKDIVKAAATSAVNKVLGVLDFIIRKTVSSNLDKIRETVKGIQYSETTIEATESSTTIQPAAAK